MLNIKERLEKAPIFDYPVTNIVDDHLLYFGESTWVKENANNIRLLAKKANLKFILLNSDYELDPDIRSYYFPNTANFQSHYTSFLDTILLYFNLPLHLKSGFIAVKKKYSEEEVCYFSEDHDFEFLSNFLLSYSEKKSLLFAKTTLECIYLSETRSQILYSPRIVNNHDDTPLEHETEEHIKVINEKLLLLQEQGKLFTILPLLQQYIQINNGFEIVSRLEIQHDNRIVLTDFNNTEIKLSHLTKSIYFLFLLHPEGIELNNINKYETELLGIYKNISNQNNWDKIRETVLQVVNNKDALYVHFSRIKSTFYKHFHKSIAEQYCVTGLKNEKKLISLDRNQTNIKDFKIKLFIE
ncbi:hypothetical protein [Sphingobacterium paucimobilis]|uniref:Uncharacterized protein n=1 Tax=Sphingobacterium paucimobilis HER1398 TaxID=1346330 RepID=U2J649_9SPHI|nr:hypothetical protein [Sphingobacterium paucimobilis]ERJ58113.1 hypothetical protein M472_04980 [Sphingobacterium paucimobilis HER1398]